MKLNIILILLLASTASDAAEAEHPYAGEQTRQIKALGAEQVAGLLAGRGLGYAKAAELNRYPGPAHVLELAQPLALSDAQAESTRAIHARMESRAKALGAQLVAAEAELDHLFRAGTANVDGVAAALETIARLQAQLRGAHLNAHIEQREVLSAEQVQRYVHLRGYGTVGHDAHDDHEAFLRASGVEQTFIAEDLDLGHADADPEDVQQEAEHL